MGIAASREFATEIANCADRGVGLESVLENPKWKLAYKRLSLELRRSIRKITSTPQEDCLSRIRQVQKSDIGIPEKLRPHFESWKHPRRFFDHAFSIFKGEDTISQVYVELRRIVDRSVHDPIRARIYAVALYDLRLLLDRNEPQNLRPAKSRNLRPKVIAKIVQVLFDSPLVDDSLKDISKWTAEFLKFGERMKAIAAGNGGLGALIVLPSSLLSMRQWAKRLNEVEIGDAIQHLQSVEVGKVAKKAKAHTVAKRIHDLILQSFISGVVDVPDEGQDEQMVDEDDEDDGEEIFEDEEDAEDTDEDETQDEKMFDENDTSSINNRSTYSNATSVSTSLNTSGQGFYPRQGYPPYPPPVEAGAEQQMATNWPVHPPHLASTFVDPQTNVNNIPRLEYLSQAADVAAQQDAPQTEGFNLTPTPHNFQRPSASLPGNYMVIQQQRNFGTESNQPQTNSGHSRFRLATFPSAAPINPKEHGLWNSSIAPDGTPVDPTVDNLYTAPDGTLVDMGVDNLWNLYIAPDGTLIDPTVDNLWNLYTAPDGTSVNPPAHMADQL